MRLPGKKLEKDIEREILDYLSILKRKHKHIHFWKQHTMGTFDPRKGVRRKSNSPYVINGISDIILIYHGAFIGLEVKTKNGRLRESQQRFKNDVLNAQGIYEIVRSVDDVRRIFETLESTRRDEGG